MSSQMWFGHGVAWECPKPFGFSSVARLCIKLANLNCGGTRRLDRQARLAHCRQAPKRISPTMW
jgi:hypothetical protein